MRSGSHTGLNFMDKLILPAGAVVFILCTYAFLLAQKVFEGKFENDPLGWYFLAKGIFCFFSLYIGVRVLKKFEKS